jgi:hypothetical protein
MSQLGHQRRFRDVPEESVLTPSTDVMRRDRKRRNVPCVDVRAAKRLRFLTEMVDGANLLRVKHEPTSRRAAKRAGADVDQLSVRWRASFAEGIDRVDFGQAVEPGEQAR